MKTLFIIITKDKQPIKHVGNFKLNTILRLKKPNVVGGIKKVIGGGCCVITGQTGNTDLVAL